ncbi:MAG: SDR family oxidoreductase [Rhizobiales bacterium]|nr:SDR family oxidoreductase [Hyphomicrobiales bacterium]
MRAVVTGAGAGLGRELVSMFAARGVAVAMVDRDAAGLEATRGGLPPAARTLSIAQDLTAEGAGEAIIGQIEAAWGGLDILVNNAGYGAIEPFFEMSAGLWNRTLAINVVALVMLSRAAGEAMKRSGGGRIVNITSPASRMALPNYAAYAASKAAVDSITRTSAIALAPFGITVNSVSPGMMDTEMQRVTERALARAEGREDFDEFIAERTRRAPLGRRARIDEVAAAVIWLALDAPAYITAERLNASGGMDRD